MGQRTTSLCHLAHISIKLGGVKLRWDPEKERFPTTRPPTSSWAGRQCAPRGNSNKTSLMNCLTSRERVRLALNHQEPDRVPVDIGASRVTGISAIAYRNLLRHLGLKEDIRVYDIKQQLADPSLEVINRLGADVVSLHRLAPTTGMSFLALDRWKPGRLTDGSACLVPEAYKEQVTDSGEIQAILERRALRPPQPGVALLRRVLGPAGPGGNHRRH